MSTIWRARPRFYEEILGLSPMFADSGSSPIDCGPRSVLLLFARGTTAETVVLPGGEIPPHDGSRAAAFRARDAGRGY